MPSSWHPPQPEFISKSTHLHRDSFAPPTRGTDANSDRAPEVMDTKNLQIDAGVTLDLAGQTMDYENPSLDPSAQVIDTVGGGARLGA